jgi:hypothetical protein
MRRPPTNQHCSSGAVIVETTTPESSYADNAAAQ